jgi:peptidoglycan biosynthesis protein MviN/MurJ (putative lipid II flippase)
LASSGAQIAAQRFAGAGRRDQAIGLVVVAAGLAGVVVAAPLGSLALLASGAAAAGVGHGLAFMNAQQELNEIAPGERRGEVTSAFLACIYAIVALSVVATGVLNEWFSLPFSVDAVAVVLVLLSLAAAAWQMDILRGRPRPASTSQRSTVASQERPLG